MAGIIGIVEYLPQLGDSKQVGDLLINGMRLIPGKNEVDINKWQQMSGHPLIQSRIDKGIIRILFENPSLIAVDTKQKEKVSARTSTPVETKLEVEAPALPVTVDMSAFVVRPPEVEKTLTISKK